MRCWITPEKKIDKIVEDAKIPIECVRVYPSEFGKLVIQSRERGEVPIIALQKTLNERRGIEYQIFLVKPYRMEDLSYFVSNPKTWKTFGEIIFKQEDLEEMCRKFHRMIETHEEPGESTVTFWVVMPPEKPRKSYGSPVR